VEEQRTRHEQQVADMKDKAEEWRLCKICLDERVWARLPCGHCQCYTCAAKMTTKETRKCAMCNRKFTEKELLTVFL
jgi:hypothetical protein